MCNPRLLPGLARRSVRWGQSIYLVLLVLTVAVHPSLGKSKAGQSTLSALRTAAGHLASRSLGAFENTLKPFLEAKAARELGAAPKDIYAPSQYDLFMVARYWDRLSPEFKRLYKEATEISPTMLSYTSPGGNFEIYYAIQGVDSVDITDNYGVDGSNWRLRVDTPNGIPDYVDETAWACDSAWSMEIDRFGFVEPSPTQSGQHTSERYAVVIARQEGDIYGMTYSSGPIPNKTTGHASHFEIRNEWTGPGWKLDNIDYRQHPEKGAHITCVHEFFHAIQYAMAWKVEDGILLDDYPVTWLEGTAVLMEDLGFDSINDYIQYCGDYFATPQEPLYARDEYGIVVYKNSLISMFLYQHADATPAIDLIKNVFYDNYTESRPFHENLELATHRSGTKWAELLNRFHAESFFTGTRAAKGRFLTDAPLLPRWSYELDTQFEGNGPLSKQIFPYAMRSYAIAHAQAHADTLTISVVFTGVTGSVPDSLTWARCILRNTSQGIDTLLQLPQPVDGSATIRVPQWGQYDQAILVATNAHPEITAQAEVLFEACRQELAAGDTVYYTPQGKATLSDPSEPVELRVTARDQLRCAARVNVQQPDSVMTEAMQEAGLLLRGTAAKVLFPAPWDGKADAQLTLRDTTTTSAGTGPRAYSWDPIVQTWVINISAESPAAHTYTIAVDSSGIHGVFELIPTPDTIFAETTTVYRPYLGKTHCTVHIGTGDSARYGGVLIRSQDTLTAPMDSAAQELELTRMPMAFAVHFPDEWTDPKGLDLTIGLDSLNAVSFFSDRTSLPPHFVLYGWNSGSRQWRSIGTTFAQDEFFEWTGMIDTSGTYIVARSGKSPSKPFVYPNPVRIRQDRSVVFEGHDLVKVWIYAMDGALVSYFDAAAAELTPGWTKESDYTFRWHLSNTGSRRVSPGTYLSLVGVKDYTTSGLSMHRRKIMLIP